MNPSWAQICYEAHQQAAFEPTDQVPWEALDANETEIWQSVAQAMLQAFLGPRDMSEERA